jgi:hypothetical protein
MIVAIATVFESFDPETGKGTGEILFQHKYNLHDTITAKGTINTKADKKNRRILKDIKRNFERSFKPGVNKLIVQFDTTGVKNK